MANTQVSLRYAKALMELAKERSLLEQVREDMSVVAETCRNRELSNLLSSPLIKIDQKESVVEKIFTHKVSAFTLLALRFLLRKNRAEMLADVAIRFGALYNEFARIQLARVTTATPLTPSLRQQIESLVQKYSGFEEIILEERLNETLLGGFVLDIDDRQINASLSHQLDILRRRFGVAKRLN